MREKAEKLRKQGMSLRRVASELGVSHVSILRFEKNTFLPTDNELRVAHRRLAVATVYRLRAKSPSKVLKTVEECTDRVSAVIRKRTSTRTVKRDLKHLRAAEKRTPHLYHSSRSKGTTESWFLLAQKRRWYKKWPDSAASQIRWVVGVEEWVVLFGVFV